MAPLAAVEQTVEWNDGALRIDGQPAPERHAARAARSEWGLFDSIASIAASGQKETPPFDMLESCSIWRTEQRILRRDWIELASAGGPMRVLDCVQIGRGIQPRHYYLDEHQRLVVVSDFFRIYQLIEEAPLGTGKKGAER
ncbi:MAG: hypothetical protein BWZ10_03494 [candidate division BRC1 bacterium ADurb.BinA364]|nr:MAG: hypothetical protein BWZ10_03494 [candidate division BRC1 bacterium ADurb.BinA364]